MVLRKTKQSIDKKFDIFLYFNKLPIRLIIFAIVVVSAYYPTAKFGLIGFDDRRIIDNAIAANADENIAVALQTDPYFKTDNESIFYRPVQNLSIAFDLPKEIKDYTRFHITNIVIHFFTVCFLSLLLFELNGNRNLTLLLSILFAVHPLLSFGVSWVAARGDLLAGLFSICSFFAFVKYLKVKKIIYIFINIFAFALSVFSKETAIVLPLLFGGYYLLFYNEKNQVSEFDLKQKITILSVWILIPIIFFAIRFSILPNAGFAFETDIQDIISNLRYIPEFTYKFFLPFNISGMAQFSFVSLILGLIIILSIIFVVFKYRTVLDLRKIGFYSAIFVLFLLPLIFYRQTNIDSSEYWEHRAYLPVLGLLLLTGELLRIFNVKSSAILIGLAIIVFIPYTNIVSRNFKDGFSFYDNIISKDYKLPNAYLNRGTLKNDYGDYFGALYDINKAISLDSNYFEAYFKRGVVNTKLRVMANAIGDFKKSLQLKSDFSDSYYNLALCYYKTGYFKESTEYLKKYIAMKPADTSAKRLLAELENSEE